MLRKKSSTLCCKNFLRSSLAYARQLCSQGMSAKKPNSDAGIANLKGSIQGKIEALSQQQQVPLHSGMTSIYRVPAKLRNVEPKDYDPQLISIGPYHRGSPHLLDSERFKRDSLNCVVGSGVRAGEERDRLSSVLATIEPEARSCYSEDVGLSRDEFVEMMLLDGCFIVELLRDLKQTNFRHSSLLPKRWMLPVVRRDLIILENQIPLTVLKTIIQEKNMSSESIDETSLEGLALNFFQPLMARANPLIKQSIASITSSSQKCHHLLDVFRSSITPGTDVVRGHEPNLSWSLTALEKANIKVRLLEYAQPLDMKFKKMEVLQLPKLNISKHTGTMLRNVVAYEQCHDECNPDMTTYVLFLSKVISSAEDVQTLQDVGVLQQTLGSNKQVAELIENLCLEVEHEGKDSYLYELIKEVHDKYSGWTIFRIFKERVKYYHKDAMSILLLYLAILQTYCAVIATQEKESLENKRILDAFLSCFRYLNDLSFETADNFQRREYWMQLIDPNLYYSHPSLAFFVFFIIFSFVLRIRDITR